MSRRFLTLAACVLLSACAGQGDYQTYYLAEQGDYDGALAAAKAAQGGGIDGIFFGTGASECRDYAAVVTVLVAKSDFAGARNACMDYDNSCAVVADTDLCFNYSQSELQSAGSDADLAESLTNEARETLHFRWLMLQDDYEGKALKRPIY